MYVRSPAIRRVMNGLAAKLDMEPVAFPPIPDDNCIMFFDRDRTDFGFLSNFHPAPIRVDCVLFASAEFYYQAQKSHDGAYQLAIRNAATPGRAKRLADSRVGYREIAKQSWFRSRPELLRGDWNEAKLDVMRRALEAKFRQHGDLRQQLLKTGTATLIEDSPSDHFWGIGRDRCGHNHLGGLLMELRHDLAHRV